MVQALKTGEIDYVRGVLADQFNALKNEPNVQTVGGVANGYTELVVQLPAATRWASGGSTSALPDPPFRDALGYAIDNQNSSTRPSAATARRAHDHPAVPHPLARRADEPAPLRHRRGQAPPRRGRLQARRDRQAARQGRQGHQPPPDLARLGAENATTPSSSRLVRPARDHGHRRGHRGRQAHRDATRAARRARPTTTSTCGAGSATPIRTPCSRSSSRARSAPRATAATTTRTTTSCSSSSAASRTRPTARRFRRDAAPRLRRGALPHPLLRRRAPRLPDRQVRRLDEPAGRRRHAALRLWARAATRC